MTGPTITAAAHLAGDSLSSFDGDPRTCYPDAVIEGCIDGDTRRVNMAAWLAGERETERGIEQWAGRHAPAANREIAGAVIDRCTRAGIDTDGAGFDTLAIRLDAGGYLTDPDLQPKEKTRCTPPPPPRP